MRQIIKKIRVSIKEDKRTLEENQNKMKNIETETILREQLTKEGYVLNPFLNNDKKNNGSLGVDIIATKRSEVLYIECIGYKPNNPARSKDFFEVFFRVISRLKNNAKKCIIALPDNFKLGMKQKVNNYGNSWQRIGNAFPEIEIWFISFNGQIEKHSWNEVYKLFK